MVSCHSNALVGAAVAIVVANSPHITSDNAQCTFRNWPQPPPRRLTGRPLRPAESVVYPQRVCTRNGPLIIFFARRQSALHPQKIHQKIVGS